MATSVSYTHLDVYKRQGCGTTKNNYDVRYLEGNEDLVNQGWQTMTDPYSGKQLVYKDYHGADVYKRQSISSQQTSPGSIGFQPCLPAYSVTPEVVLAIAYGFLFTS